MAIFACRSRLVLMPAACLLAIGLSSCNKSSFTGNSPKTPAVAPPPTPPPATPTPTPSPSPTPAPLPPVTQTTRLTCDQLSDPAAPPLQVHAPAGANLKLIVQGELCPISTGALTVLFIVDWSGSMAQNDPATAGSCGRSQAAQVVLEQIKKESKPGIRVQAAMIPFSSDVIQSGVILPTPIDTFLPQISADTFCQHGGTTNYIAAFKQAQQLLAGVAGRSIIYFISDGAPNVAADGSIDPQSTPDPNSQATKDSIAAGQQLHTAVPGLTIDALLLGSDGTQQAQGIMQQIAGSADDVRLVADASQLSTAILQFPSVSLNDTTASATLASALSPPLTVKFTAFTEDSTRPGVWTFTTEPMSLTGTPHKTVVNTLDIDVKGSDGSDEKTAIIIDYTAD